MMNNKIVLFAVFVIGWSYNIRGNPFSENSLEWKWEHSSLFEDPDEAVGKLLQETIENGGNPEELGTYYEGDMLMPMNRLGRNGVSVEDLHWTNGTIPYIIEGTFDENQLQTIQKAIQEFNTKTCIEIILRTDEPNYISFNNSATGCWTYGIGMLGGKQIVNLQTPNCTNKIGTVIHEILHAAGFVHEQNRPDRDPFVEIMWRNVQTKLWMNFVKVNPLFFTANNVSYDYGSVMHYSPNAFSKNGTNITIKALKDDESVEKMGQRDGFSEKDILKIKLIYCPDLI